MNFQDQISRVQPMEKLQSQAGRQAVNEQEIARLMRGHINEIRDTTARETMEAEAKQLERGKLEYSRGRNRRKNKRSKTSAESTVRAQSAKSIRGKNLESGSLIDMEA